LHQVVQSHARSLSYEHSVIAAQDDHCARAKARALCDRHRPINRDGCEQ
jgi:hypothetical protein